MSHPSWIEHVVQLSLPRPAAPRWTVLEPTSEPDWKRDQFVAERKQRLATLRQRVNRRRIA